MFPNNYNTLLYFPTSFPFQLLYAALHQAHSLSFYINASPASGLYPIQTPLVQLLSHTDTSSHADRIFLLLSSQQCSTPYTNYSFCIKTSMAEPIVENLLPQFVWSINNYLQQCYWSTQSAAQGCSRPKPATDNGVRDGRFKLLTVTIHPLRCSPPSGYV